MATELNSDGTVPFLFSVWNHFFTAVALTVVVVVVLVFFLFFLTKLIKRAPFSRRSIIIGSGSANHWRRGPPSSSNCVIAPCLRALLPFSHPHPHRCFVPFFYFFAFRRETERERERKTKNRERKRERERDAGRIGSDRFHFFVFIRLCVLCLFVCLFFSGRLFVHPYGWVKSGFDDAFRLLVLTRVCFVFVCFCYLLD